MNFLRSACHVVSLVSQILFYLVMVAGGLTFAAVLAVLNIIGALVPLAVFAACIYFGYLGVQQENPITFAAGAVPAAILIGLRDRK